ncbi:recombinase family protein [Brevibacillus thermoruber]|uniref:recombinase family protein n=1 Tax=Brevibacillus thermoruber TaxID=33942 RepID=UPI0005513BC2|nr:recombinase family protein [Brevibacillus thermoruber]
MNRVANSLDTRAAVYVRVSTTKESQKDSPEHQVGICREKARLLNIIQPDDLVYEDRDTGTSIVDRPAIKKLVADAQKGFFQVVIFASLSRFSRDTMDSLMLKRTLVDSLKIRLISIDENYDSYIDNDEFKFQIFAAVNQKQSELISLSSRRGIRQSALKGNFTGSIAPYGYRKAIIGNRKTLVPDEQEKEIVKLIFQLYTANKMGEKAIVTYLNGKNIPSPKGGNWGVTSVQRILQNEVYTGANVFSKYEVVKVHSIDDLHNRKKVLVQRDKSLWERSIQEPTHEPIIDKDLFLQAQQIREMRGGGKRGGVRNKVNVFAGFIKCKHCGSAMVSMKSNNSNRKRDGKEYRYLICSKRRRQGDAGCHNNYWLPYYEFRDELINDIADKLQSITSAQQLFETHKGLIQINTTTSEREIAEQENKINKYREALYSLRKAVLDGEIDEKQFHYEKAQFEKEIKQYESRLNELQKTLNKRDNLMELYDEVMESLEELLTLTYDEEDEFDELRLILMKLIQQILVEKDGNITIKTTFGDSLNDIFC